jgi:isopenicillin-N epimerase
VVLEAQSRLREQLEREPVTFLVRELEGRLDEARAALARFVGARPDELAFVPNATTGVNAVLRALPLDAGDELLVTDHEYNACRNVLDYVAARAGATVVVAHVPFPVASEDELVHAVLAPCSPRTRYALVDHVTSPTGLVLPVARIVRDLAARGVEVLVDGAHAPGMVPLDLGALGASFYTANCHKWLCTPKGSALLYVRRDRQALVRPAVISHGANSPRADRPRFLLEFDWTGTCDPSPYLCVPVALRFLEELLPGGWPALMARNRDLALTARAQLCARWQVAPPCPESMIGTLAAIPLPPARSGRWQGTDGDPLHDVLFARHGIEVPVLHWPAPPRRLLRLSAQAYNSLEEYAYLGRCVQDELAAGC